MYQLSTKERLGRLRNSKVSAFVFFPHHTKRTDGTQREYPTKGYNLNALKTAKHDLPYVAAKFAYNTQIQLGGGPKYTRGGGGGGLSPRDPTPPHSHTPPPPPTPTQKGVELGGGDENVKTIHTVTTSKDNAFFSIPLSPFKHCCTDRVRNLKC